MSKRKIALFDIDGTILPLGVGIFSVIKHLSSLGLVNPIFGAEVLRLKEQYKEGKIEYEDYVTQVFINLARGLEDIPEDEVQIESKNHLEKEIRKHIYSYAKSVIANLLKTHDVYLITSNTHFYAEYFAHYLGATGYRSTSFEVSNGLFTGKIKKFLTKSEEKQQAVKELFLKYPYEHSIAFGDAEGDRKMLDLVEIPICINPTKGMKKIAREKGWIITNELEVWGIVIKYLS